MGELNQRDGARGISSQSWVENTNLDFQSINSAKHSQSINSFENTLFWPECKAPFYRFISAPDSNPVSDPDSNPDPKRLFRFRIGSVSGQKFRILPDPVPVPDPDPQHSRKENTNVDPIRREWSHSPSRILFNASNLPTVN